jgi:1-pyrroline-5-carboxylate dehydrogenase
MTTLNYTSTAGDPALDEAFEAALQTARKRRAEPLAHLIDGRFVADGELFERRDPCDAARVVSRAHRASPEIVAQAVAAARAAQPAWAATPLAERMAALRRIARLIGERAVEMGGVVAAETGKVRLEAVPEVQEGIDLIEAYCGHMERNDGYRIRLGQLSPDEHNTSVMLPYGVFAVICPFNFPFALAIGMSTGALVTGNTVVMSRPRRRRGPPA